MIDRIVMHPLQIASLSLHWFKSDLTPDNMRMLRMDRPGIKL